MNNEQVQAKLKIIFAMVTFGTIGIFVRNIELPSTIIALARGIIGTLFLLLVVFGGLGSVRGSVIAAIVLKALPEALRGFDDYRMLIYSLMLIFIMLFNSSHIFDGFKRLFSIEKAIMALKKRTKLEGKND